MLSHNALNKIYLLVGHQPALWQVDFLAGGSEKESIQAIQAIEQAPDGMAIILSFDDYVLAHGEIADRKLSTLVVCTPQKMQDAFMMGATDCMAEYHERAELFARLTRLGTHDLRIFSWGTLFTTGQLSRVGAVDLELPPSGHRILHALARAGQTPISRKVLNGLSGMTNASSRIVDVYIAAVRKRLFLALPKYNGVIIETVHNVGYRLSI